MLSYVERFKKLSAYQVNTVLIDKNSFQPLCIKTSSFVPITKVSQMKTLNIFIS